MVTVHFDTIAALSSAPGEAAIAMIRVSGEGALALLDRVARQPSGRTFDAPWEHRRLYHAGLFESGGERIDDAMVAVMRGPESYTGEDVVEIACHGGTAVVARLLETLYAAGARPAEPGEFTRRAFLNGKMDLIQAEAVADLIHARTEIQRVVAERQLAGGLSRRIDALADEMLGLLGTIEANIDFIEEGIDALDIPETLRILHRQRAEVEDLLSSASLSRPLRDGYQVVIAGPVNAGKSSLFNRLVGESRAIVTDMPGTTRDVLRETVSLDGVPVVIHDTAGLRGGPADPVETIGMDRARGAARDADIVVFVVDGSMAIDTETRRAMDSLDAAHAVVVINKHDLPGVDSTAGARAGLPVVQASALTGEGIAPLRAEIRRLAGTATLSRMARERSVLNARLAALMREALEQIGDLAGLVETAGALEILASRARELLGIYEEATGRRYRDGLLDVIFSRFCIGK